MIDPLPDSEIFLDVFVEARRFLTLLLSHLSIAYAVDCLYVNCI